VRSPHRLVWTLATGLIIMYLVAAGWSFYERVRTSSEFVYGEAVILDETHRIRLGQPLYPAPTALPLTVTAYPPVYYFIVSWLQQFSGDLGYTMGRLVSMGAVLVSAALIAWSVKSIAGRWCGGLLAAGLFLTRNLAVLLWAPAHRVDTLALCFTLPGLSLATRGRTTVAALPLGLAILTKQSYLAAPLCVVLTLWPRRRSIVGFGALFIGILSVCAGIAA
jgi:hypothetical protein